MNILFVCKNSPFHHGGAETRTREVAMRLSRLGHNVTVLCGRTSSDEPDFVVYNGVTILCKAVLPDAILRKWPYPSYISLAAASLLLVFHLHRLLKSVRFDLIREDIAPFPPSFWLAFRRMPGSKRLAVIHNTSKTLRGWVRFYGPIYGVAGWIMDRQLRAGRLKYDRIICDSRWFAEELRRYKKIAENVSYVPNGVDVAAFGQRRHSSRGQAVTFLTVGRLVETKGHRYAVQALAQVIRTFRNARLVLVGDGPLRSRLVGITKDLNIAHAVEFMSAVSYDKMPELYALHDFFLMPSLFEGLPVALIEAMASKLPVVASNIPAIVDVVGTDAAILVPPADAGKLAEAMHWAIEHPEEMAANARCAHEIAKRYDWNSTALAEIA